MNTTKLFLTLMFAALLGNPLQGRADDIDIYSGLSGSAGLPNVLIILDNAANFDASADACSYTDSGTPPTPTLSGKTGGIEQCALNNVINSLGTNSDGSAKINLGIMIYNANGFGTLFGSGCVGSAGGCLMVPLTAMDATGKSTIMTQIKSWSVTGSSSMKSNNEADASAMQEAWAYYAGKQGMSGRTYTSPATGGCQKNFVIFISNAFNNSGTPGDASQAPGTLLTTTVNGNTALTSAQKTTFNTTITIPSGSYGTSSFSCGSYTMPNHNDGSGLYADEWARYMYDTDLSTGAVPASKDIITYAIGVLSTSCKPDWPALLTSMARYGGGKYFATSSYNDVANALLKVLNEVQAVNSVFASSSLPVSVNAQGTYLNQIYMGMFRPDPGALPRWAGNLKQYQFIMGGGGALQLGDSLGNAALSSAGTGFISPNAVSFWTCGHTPTGTACGVGTEPANGFWVNDPSSLSAASLGFDLPDGALVERGGAAQQIRMKNLTDDYTAVAGTPTNPRNLYTYCPSGSNCHSSLTYSNNPGSNAFATNNADISASQLGSTSKAVSSIVRTGTSALVTTIAAHGFNTGDSVTITGATQPEYNVTQNITVNSTTTFTITGLPDYPTTPSQGAYTAGLHNAATQSISGITRSSAATTGGTYSQGCTPNLNCETATVTTAAAHGYSAGNSVLIAGASPADYNGTKTILAGGLTSTAFTYSVPVYPTAPAANTYRVVEHPYSKNITGIVKSGSYGVVTTSAAHGFHVGESVTISGTSTAYYNATWTITSTTSTTFNINITGNPANSTGGTVVPSTTPVTIATLTRGGTTTSATASATGLTASAFANGDSVDITLQAGSAANETAYIVSNVAITCSGTCTSFTYPITTAPAYPASGTMTVALATSSVTIPATNITRSGTTATVTGVANTFVAGNFVDISTSGTAYSNESAYTAAPSGGWQITCPVSCSTAFTFGPVTLTPATPATGSISVYSGAAPLDKTTLINWVRGQDNQGDEFGPGGTVTVRPSVHGDVLHSRPMVVNYGGSTGVVVYYGDNGGVFHAVNGNQSAAIGAVGAGNELWGFIPREFFSRLGRLMTNSPMVCLPTTPGYTQSTQCNLSAITPTPMKKDYFVDGGAGLYQLIDGNGVTQKAYLYLSMRRGGNLIYALDVTDPAAPQFLWKVDNTSPGMGELGQTWSQPKVAKVEGYTSPVPISGTSPVLIFGAGYDTNEDNQPPTADSSGRGIFVLDAITGALVWKATYGATSVCPVTGATTTQASCTVSDMNYAIPADITLTDRDGDGIIERFYAADTGGNIWRVDLEPTAGNTPDKWRVYKLAALGCDTGPCAAGTTPRKFLYPPDVIPATATYQYDSVVAGSGDREHPLHQTTGTPTSDKLFLIKDTYTGNDATGMTPVTLAGLFDATNFDPTTMTCRTPYYISLASEEKVVNAPLVAAGYAYMSTNQPATASPNSCTTNLGIAKGYRLNPFACTSTSTVFSGGGLPPSPVGGVVNIVVGGVTTQVPFLIGVGGNTGCVGSDCSSALGGQKPPITVNSKRTRTYWYIDNK